MSAGRSTTVRDDSLRKRLRGKYARLCLPCGVCRGQIDYSLRHPDPMSLVVDHIIPLDRGGIDVEENCQSAHRSCNRRKWNKLPHELLLDGPRTFVTHRTW